MRTLFREDRNLYYDIQKSRLGPPPSDVPSDGRGRWVPSPDSPSSPKASPSASPTRAIPAPESPDSSSSLPPLSEIFPDSDIPPSQRLPVNYPIIFPKMGKKEENSPARSVQEMPAPKAPIRKKTARMSIGPTAKRALFL